MPKTLLAKNAEVLVTMDGERREIPGGAIYADGNAIVSVGKTADLPPTADVVLDLANCVVLPGLVNTHHHMVQTLTRAVPAAQDAELFGWLKALYPLWANLTPEMVEVATLTAMAELMLSGCTTTSDHLYIFPNGARLDDCIGAAARMGIRFHASRGAMSLGESKGGLPPDALVEDESSILADMRRVIEAYHDPSRFSMRRVVVAPCSPFTVTRDLMREAAALAQSYGVSMHTHLAENENDVAYSREKFQMTPAEYAKDLGWLGPDVWHAHAVMLDGDGIAAFARSATGIAHCPSSNMRLASGIAPVRKMREAGVPVALGVDGSASNDGAHMLAEVRQAMLLQRVGHGPAAMTAREALELATVGGADVLGRDDIGALAPGMAADFVAFDMTSVGFAGARHDPVAALVFCAPAAVAHSVIDGRVVVRDGKLLTLDLGPHVERHNRLSKALVRGEKT